MNIKRAVIVICILTIFISCINTKQKTIGKANNDNWIKFTWESATLSNKYFPKFAMLVPIKINGLNANFELQFDLGANTSVLYGNILNSYFSESEIKNMLIDSTKLSSNDKISYHATKGIDMLAGNFKIEKITYMENYGKAIPKDSLFTKTPKHIGSLGADAFVDKILIIDFPSKKMCVLDTLKGHWKSRTTFVQAQSKRGRLHVPLKINQETHWFLFDTGASLFPINTNKKLWTEIVQENTKADTLITSSWGENINFYGKMTAKNIYLGDKKLEKNYAWYSENKRLMEFNTAENIDGLIGNAYFFNEIIILDFKNNRFGIVN
ncbi:MULTISPECIES: aspartyl protease family protein [unclassified Sphingobacterium]|uniref:aspartyl protease family protein n=1 Tax=unclassified Sphingobacterium TaxID=2609468 RepID=UPI0025F37948|nr:MULTISPECIES: aspartyl protease family protein [unclassified Sphingobacterium]